MVATVSGEGAGWPDLVCLSGVESEGSKDV